MCSKFSGFKLAQKLLLEEKYDKIIPTCCDEIESPEGQFKNEALVLRGTFYILSKQQDLAFDDLRSVAENESADVKLRVNALIKRASLFIQKCQDPIKDPELSFQDFRKAAEIDPQNADVYHHRGQVIMT